MLRQQHLARAWLDGVVVGCAAVGGHRPALVSPAHLGLYLGLQRGKPLRLQNRHRHSPPYVVATGTWTHAEPLWYFSPPVVAVVSIHSWAVSLGALVPTWYAFHPEALAPTSDAV